MCVRENGGVQGQEGTEGNLSPLLRVTMLSCGSWRRRIIEHIPAFPAPHPAWTTPTLSLYYSWAQSCTAPGGAVDTVYNTNKPPGVVRYSPNLPALGKCPLAEQRRRCVWGGMGPARGWDD